MSLFNVTDDDTTRRNQKYQASRAKSKLNSLHIVTTHTEDVGVQLTAHKVH